MTAEEMAVYEKMNFSYGKWWLPAHWFTALAVRAKKEGRIKDSVMLKALLEVPIPIDCFSSLNFGYFLFKWNFGAIHQGNFLKVLSGKLYLYLKTRLFRYSINISDIPIRYR